jgi:hypothetical protein
MEEDAVAIGKLDQALADADLPHIAPLEFLDVKLDERREGRDFLVRDPDIARRAGTAIATLGALKFESSVIPGFFVHIRL